MFARGIFGVYDGQKKKHNCYDGPLASKFEVRHGRFHLSYPPGPFW
jgi:hypothetical protein